MKSVVHHEFKSQSRFFPESRICTINNHEFYFCNHKSILLESCFVFHNTNRRTRTCCLLTELLLIFCVVTPVSVARTGGGICRQIKQFRTVFGVFTSLAYIVYGELHDSSMLRAWSVFSNVLEPSYPLSIVWGQYGFGHYWRQI